MLSDKSISFGIYLDFTLHLYIIVSVVVKSVGVHATIVVIDVVKRVNTVVDNVGDLVVLLLEEVVGVLGEARCLLLHWATIHSRVFGNLLDMVDQCFILLAQELLLRNRLFYGLSVESFSEYVHVRTVKLLVLRRGGRLV